MKTVEFRRQLAELGATFVEAAKHTKVYLGGRQSTMPRHREIGKVLGQEILKRLGVGKGK